MDVDKRKENLVRSVERKHGINALGEGFHAAPRLHIPRTIDGATVTSGAL
jgi:hypothetical protein